MAYNTGNPVGSRDPRDFLDNAENIDEWANSTATSQPDRLGAARKTWHGMEQEHLAAQAARASTFQAFLSASGYVDMGDYGPGIELTARHQLLLKDGAYWRLHESVPLPYTTTGTWAGESGNFVSTERDAPLRQELAAPGGARMVGNGGIVFDSVADMQAATWLTIGQKVRTLGYYTPGDGGGNDYEIVASATGTDDGGSFIDLSGSGLQAKGLFNFGFNAAHYGLSESNSGYQNCKALQALSAAVIAAGGGKVYFPSGDYTVGAQNFAGATGKGYAYQYEKMFEVAGLTKPISVHFDGVRFKFADGLRYGSFDPVTGDPISPTLPYYNNDSRAQTGHVINISNCPIVSVEGSLEIDGRDSTRIIGGLWGDRGRQLIEYGLRIANCYIYTVEGAFYFHNLCLDGLYLGNRADDNCAGTITGVVSLYNGRQGVSVGGGRSITFTSCVFGLTGFGAVSSSPAAAVDLEPELYPLRGVVFNNCRLLKAKGSSLVADDFNTRGVVLNDCVIENDTNTSIYTKVSNTKFNRCTIRGSIICYSGTNTNQGNFGLFNLNAYPEFNDCELYNTMDDGSHAYGYPRVTGNIIAKLNNCTAFVNLDGSSNLAIWADYSNVNGLRIVLSGQVLEAASAIAYFRNHRGLRDVYVENNSTVAAGADPAITARIEVGGASVAGPTENLFIEKSVNGFENVLWSDSYRSAGGRAGFHMDNYVSSRDDEMAGILPASKRIALAKRGYNSLGYYKPQTITSNNVVPTSGDYVRGDIIVNSDPVAAGAFGWMCTTTGTAGSTAVFKVITNIGA